MAGFGAGGFVGEGFWFFEFSIERSGFRPYTA